jgi:CRP-like cAMP-binding protein
MNTADLRKLPLFRDIKDEHLTALLGAFEKTTHPAGHVLFEAGSVPERFLLLAKGEVTLSEGLEPRFTLRPLAPIGELGSLTGIPRNSTATAATDIEVWSIRSADLTSFFEKRADVAFPFYRNLLEVVSEKVRRDRRRMGEMRQNIVSTQKMMKKLRDIVLDAAETPISAPICDLLDGRIETNRRAHYRVSPTEAFPAALRLDDGSRVRVIDISEGYMKIDAPTGRLQGDWVAVLELPDVELPVSGSIERAGKDGVVVKLDLMIDDYKAKLDDYVTRVQLLDFVV